MMRLKAYIAAIVTSVVFLLIMPFVPHHHHGSEICLTEEICDDPEAHHDCGHHDHHSNHMPGFPSHCIEKSDYLTGRQQHSALSHLLFSADAGIMSQIIPTLEANETELLTTACTDVTCHINPTRFYRIGSLRAPPEIF